MLALVLAASLATPRVDYVKRQAVAAGVPITTVEFLFGDQRIDPDIKFTAGKSPLTWKEAITNLLKPESVARGYQYLREHQEFAKRAAEKYGVDGASLVAVMKVETDLGSYPGDYRVFNVFLTNLIRASEQKWRWHGENLVNLIQYCRQANRDCFEIRGSWAGAFGLPQFLPFSFTHYGVDGDGDDVIDLFNPADAFVSCASFLAAHGWKKDQLRDLAAYFGAKSPYQDAVLRYAVAVRALIENDAKKPA